MAIRVAPPWGGAELVTAWAAVAAAHAGILAQAVLFKVLPG